MGNVPERPKENERGGSTYAQYDNRAGQQYLAGGQTKTAGKVRRARGPIFKGC